MRGKILPHLLPEARYIEDDIHAMAPGGARVTDPLPGRFQPDARR